MVVKKIIKKDKEFFEKNKLWLLPSKLIKFEGDLGYCKKKFRGKDITVKSCKTSVTLFVRSKASYRVLKVITKKLLNGLLHGYYVELAFVGLGYRFTYIKKKLLMKLGFAHYIEIKCPQSIHMFGYKKKLFIFGVTLSQVNSFAAQICKFQKNDVYKGKGIQIFGKTRSLKVGKQNL